MRSLALFCGVSFASACGAPATVEGTGAPESPAAQAAAAEPATGPMSVDPAASPPATGGGGGRVLRPQVWTFVAIVAAIKEGYETYKDMNEMLNMGLPTEEDQILAELQTLEDQFAQIKSQLDQINQGIASIIWQDRRAYFLDNLKQIELIRATARSASEEITQWKNGGKTDALMLDNALHDSLLAANQLLEGRAFFMRPGETAGAPDVFDYRSALPAYLYVLTVRQGVLSVAAPNFRSDTVYQQEFKAHYDRLGEILNSINGLVSCTQVGSSYIDSQQMYGICSTCTDPLSNYVSRVAGSYTPTATPSCVQPVYGSTDDYNNSLQFYSFYDNRRVREEMGYWDAQAFRDILFENTHKPIINIMPSPPKYEPLIGYGGKCMEADGSGAAHMRTCNGSPAQQWYFWGNGTLQNQSGQCIEPDHWETHNGTPLFTTECLVSGGEKWSINSATEVRGRGNKCLDISAFDTSEYAKVQLWDCNGLANQHWVRFFFHIPPGGLHL